MTGGGVCFIVFPSCFSYPTPTVLALIRSHLHGCQESLSPSVSVLTFKYSGCGNVLSYFRGDGGGVLVVLVVVVVVAGW